MCAVVDSQFQAANVTSVIHDLECIPDGTTVTAVIMTSIAACKGVAANASGVIMKLGALPTAFTIGTEPNMTKLAVLGHTLYSLSEDIMGPEMRVSLEVYRGTLGGPKNVFAAGANFVIEGKEERVKVLRQYNAKTAPSESDHARLIKKISANPTLKKMLKEAATSAAPIAAVPPGFTAGPTPTDKKAGKQAVSDA